MTKVTVGKWGNNLAIRLPGDVVDATNLQNGARVEVFTAGKDIVIRQMNAEDEVASWFSGKPLAEWHAEYAAVDVEWGPDVGREIVPE